ncbi:hypothetical protein EP232_01370 [bacterium]|nr:MAG: hypothetical protein EP232_01370 [bacterium]
MRAIRWNSKASIPLLLFVLLLAAGLMACKKSPPPANTQVPVTVKPKPVQAAAVIEEPEEVEQFRYNPGEYRDPFASLVQVKKVRLDIPEEELTPLQRVSISDMTLEGIIILGKKSVAHVITPDGKAHIVTVGTLMGRNRGKIKRIVSDRIVVEEQFEDYMGNRIKQETVLRLREEEGENS